MAQECKGAFHVFPHFWSVVGAWLWKEGSCPLQITLTGVLSYPCAGLLIQFMHSDRNWSSLLAELLSL